MISKSIFRALLREFLTNYISDRRRSLKQACLVIIFDSIPAQAPGAQPRPVSVRVSPNLMNVRRYILRFPSHVPALAHNTGLLYTMSWEMVLVIGSRLQHPVTAIHCQCEVWRMAETQGRHVSQYRACITNREELSDVITF